MHIEMDVLEGIVLIGSWFFLQWTFRAIFLILIGKVIGDAVKRGKDSIGEKVATFGERIKPNDEEENT